MLGTHRFSERFQSWASFVSPTYSLAARMEERLVQGTSQLGEEDTESMKVSLVSYRAAVAANGLVA